MNAGRYRGVWSACLFVAGLLGGCRSNPRDMLIQRNFSQVHPSTTTRAEVSAMLGAPEHRIGDTWMYTRPERHLTVIIDFDDQGRVARKQWIDGESGRWNDSDDR